MDSGIKIKNKYKDYGKNHQNNIDDIMKQFGKLDFIIKIIEIFTKIKIFFNKCIDKSPLLMSLLAGIISKPAFHSEKSIFYFISVFMFFSILESLRVKKKTKRFFFSGLLYGCGLYGHSFYWLSQLNDFGFQSVSLDQFLGTFGFLSTTIFLGFNIGVMSYLASKFAYNKFSLLMYYSIFITLFEIYSHIIVALSPLQCLAHGCIGMTYFIQIGSVVGTFGVSFIYFTIIIFLMNTGYRKYALYLYFGCCFFGFYRKHIKFNYSLPKEKFDIKVVQPNFLGWAKYKYTKPICDDFATLSGVDGFKETNKKLLVIAPESIISDSDDQKDYFVKRVCKVIGNNGDSDDVIIPNELKDKECNIIACTGCYENRGKGKFHNTYRFYSYDYKNNEKLYLDYYDKKYLIPFGERVPDWIINFGRKIVPKRFKIIHDVIDEYERENLDIGIKTNTIFIDGVSPFSMEICSDIFRPGVAIDDNRSTWILSTVNYRMFNATRETYLAKLGQQFGKFRAIEYGRPVVMCINFGYSSVINCNGKVLKDLYVLDQGVIDYEMPLKYDISMFSYWGYYFLKLIVFLAFLCIFFGREDRKNKILKKLEELKNKNTK